MTIAQTTAEPDDAIAIAAVMSDGSDSLYGVLAEVARRLASEGCRLAGVVQLERDATARSNCEMTLCVLPDGPRIGISQALGKHATGCRLDHEALEEAAGLVDRTLDSTIELLILNKFGKREGEGAGFRQTIAHAVALGIPVLVGLSDAERSAFEEFAGDLVPILPAQVDAVLSWCRKAAA